jgi:hypothetical protein
LSIIRVSTSYGHLIIKQLYAAVEVQTFPGNVMISHQAHGTFVGVYEVNVLFRPGTQFNI